MLYPSINELETLTNSRYSLVIVIAKRARQILEQADANKVPLTEKAVKTAILDVAQGKVTAGTAFAAVNFDQISNDCE